MKKTVAFFIAFFMMCMPVFVGFVEDNNQSPQSANVGGEWAVIGMNGAGTLSENTKNAYLNNLESRLKETGGVLSDRKYTEYSRVAIALKSLGENPQAFRGYNLLRPLSDKEKVGKQGLNGTIFALIALTDTNACSEEYKMQLIDEILAEQNPQGAFIYGGQADADVTAMAMCALAPYTDIPRVKEAADKAADGLSTFVNENGYIDSNGVTSESISQSIIGLTALGINPETDSRFVRGGKGLVSRLGDFKVDGGYSHLKGDGINPMASEQGLCAEAAYKLYNEGKSLYCTKKLTVSQVFAGLLEVITGEK